MVSLYALVLSCVINVIEGHDLATVDIPGAFLQTPMPEGEDVYIWLDGTMAELLCKVNPKMYRKHLINKNGKKTLFTRAQKAIYGTLQAALLFWEKLYGQLEEWGGFETQEKWPEIQYQKNQTHQHLAVTDQIKKGDDIVATTSPSPYKNKEASSESLGTLSKASAMKTVSARDYVYS